jgi:hypothetical protein
VVGLAAAQYCGHGRPNGIRVFILHWYYTCIFRRSAWDGWTYGSSADMGDTDNDVKGTDGALGCCV